MTTKDALGKSCDKMLCIHVRRVHHLAFDPYETIRCTQRVFGPHGIAVNVLSIQSAHVPKGQVERFSKLTGPWDWDTADADRYEMYNRFGTQDLASVMVFLVSRLGPDIRPGGSAKPSAAQRPALWSDRASIYRRSLRPGRSHTSWGTYCCAGTGQCMRTTPET